jgi:GT2 family glycosyltransferase
MEEELYFRAPPTVWYDYDEKRLKFNKTDRIAFDTYFNSFSIGKWKKLTDIEDLYLYLKLKGEALLKIYHIDEHHIVHLKHITPVKEKEILTKIDSKISNGLVYFELVGQSQCELIEASWRTTTKPKREIKLGLSITTFNREDAVKSSSKRIVDFLHQTDIDAHLVVVDNGKNVELEKDEKLTLIPNENLGGSGGFARGLYYLKEERDDFSHAIFMDDDAFCETESIYRAYRFLEYAKDKKTAIAGSMLMGDNPAIQWENGAKFNRHCIPQKSYFNLRDRIHVVENEKIHDFDYGGWWFFAFPIKDAQYPYPFFVRGDDVNFGLQKQFMQTTLNGVATWGDDFSYKESPFTLYLDTRQHLLQHIQVKSLNKSSLTLIYIFLSLSVKYASIYRYASAQAQLEAVRDVLKGPSFFEENISMSEVFKKLRPLMNEEKLQPISLTEKRKYKLAPSLPQIHFFMRMVKLLTLNGHLLPQFLFSKDHYLISKTDHRFGAFFMKKELLIYYEPTGEGFVLKHDKKRFFSIIKDATKLSWEIFKNRDRLINEYNSRYDYLTSKEYWQKQFFKDNENRV